MGSESTQRKLLNLGAERPRVNDVYGISHIVAFHVKKNLCCILWHADYSEGKEQREG
jgi:hypothetical protein